MLIQRLQRTLSTTSNSQGVQGIMSTAEMPKHHFFPLSIFKGNGKPWWTWVAKSGSGEKMSNFGNLGKLRPRFHLSVLVNM